MINIDHKKLGNTVLPKKKSIILRHDSELQLLARLGFITQLSGISITYIYSLHSK